MLKPSDVTPDLLWKMGELNRTLEERVDIESTPLPLGVYLLIILFLSPDMTVMTSRILCDHRIILVYVDRAKNMEKNAIQCKDQNTPLPLITLPNVEVRLAQWRNRTSAQQGTEVFSHLTHLLNVTQNVNSPKCFSEQLKRLRHSVMEIQGLVNKAWRIANNNTQLFPEVNLTSNYTLPSNSSDSMDIFLTFSRLLQGKVTFLMQTLREENCR
ncbi:thrombopoietin [Gastrophryne carolinensis]